MTKNIELPTHSANRYFTPSTFNNVKLLLSLLVVNSLIWSSVLVYLTITPKQFSSKWSIILTGQAGNAAVSLNNVGAVNLTQGSGFGQGLAIDPRANYKTILESSTVTNLASQQLKLSPEEFGLPNVELINPTAVIELTVDAPSPKQAQAKAIALQNSFELQLNKLRADEVSKKQGSVYKSINDAKNKLRDSQLKLATFQRQTGLLTDEQIPNLIARIEQLNSQRTDLSSQYSDKLAQYNQLKSQLGTNPTQVVRVLPLQNDSGLNQAFSKLDSLELQIAEASSKLSPNHPTLINLHEQKLELTKDIQRRAQLISKQNLSINQIKSLKASVPISPTNNQDGLYLNLIKLNSEANGLRSQLSVNSNAINSLNSRLNTLSSHQPVLQNLQRDVKLSEAILTSTLGRLDAVKIDIYNTYPLVQVLDKPDLPSSASSPKTLYALLGALLSSSFASLGLFLLWKKSSSQELKDKANFNYKVER